MSKTAFFAQQPISGAARPGSLRRASVLKLTLRTKWVLAFAGAVLYLVIVGLISMNQRQGMLTAVQELEAIHPVEEQLTKVNTSVSYAILQLQELYHAPESSSGYARLVIDIEGILAGLQQLQAAHRGLQPSIVRLERHVEQHRDDTSRAALVALRAGLYELVTRLDDATRSVRARRDRLLREYRLLYDSVTMTSIMGGLIGILVFGGAITLFLTRLTWDLNKLKARALDVVSGCREGVLDVTRRDEVGALMQAVNGMQSALRARECELEVSRQQRFHQEKMAAIGSLAAAIGHEINNPIAAIYGIAQAMQGAQLTGECPGNVACRPEMILEQTRRISQITRQLSEMTAQPSLKPALLDLNALVRKVCNFVRYDKRMRNVELELELDAGLPAVRCIADHVTQVLMNLLINAADATEGVSGRKARITVRTEVAGSGVALTVADNGCGMDAATLAQACEEGFTTKPVGKGSGLGLFICKSLVEQCGGSFMIGSTPGQSTTVRIHLPLPEATA